MMQAINNLRGIAILAIVATHANELWRHYGPFASLFDYYVGNFTFVFMFLAGYLFASQTANFHYRDYLKSKLLNVALPYLILTIPASLSLVIGSRTTTSLDMAWFKSIHPVLQYLYLLLTGRMLGPLWFIPMILIFYAAAPVFKAVSKSGPLMIAIFLISAPISHYIQRDASNPLHGFVYFLPLYLLGMLAYRYDRFFRNPGRIALSLCFLFLFVFGISYSAPFRSQEMFYVPLCIVLLVLTKRFCNRRIAWLDMFARLSFFIFFVHQNFFGMARHILMNVLHLKPPETVLAEIGTLVLSLALGLPAILAAFVILKLITGRHSRYLIGA